MNEWLPTPDIEYMGVAIISEVRGKDCSGVSRLLLSDLSFDRSRLEVGLLHLLVFKKVVSYLAVGES